MLPAPTAPGTLNFSFSCSCWAGTFTHLTDSPLSPTNTILSWLTPLVLQVSLNLLHSPGLVGGSPMCSNIITWLCASHGTHHDVLPLPVWIPLEPDLLQHQCICCPYHSCWHRGDWINTGWTNENNWSQNPLRHAKMETSCDLWLGFLWHLRNPPNKQWLPVSLIQICIFTARLQEFFKNLFVFLYFSPSLSNFVVVAVSKNEIGFPSVINT